MSVPAAEAPMVFRFVGESLSDLTTSYVARASGQLIGILGPIAVAGITLFLMIYAIMVMYGKISSPASDFTIKMLKLSFIAMFALNADSYMGVVVGTVGAIESELTVALSPTDQNARSTYEALDNGLGVGISMVLKCWGEASKKNPIVNPGHFGGWSAAAFLIAVGMLWFIVVGGAVVVIAKFMLAILLAIGPLFVMCLMWPATAQFFDRWLSQVLTCVFTTVILSIVFGMGLQIYHQLMSAVAGSEWDSPTFMGLQILCITLILGALTAYAGVKASALGGGAAVAAVTMGQAAGLLTRPGDVLKSAGRMMNPVSNRLDPNTNLQTSSSALEHFAMGRSFVSLNPAYRRAVLDQFRRSMGINNKISGG